MPQYVLVEYPAIRQSGSPDLYYAGNRRQVPDVGMLDLTPEEAAEMNKRMLLTPCRVLPALGEFKP